MELVQFDSIVPVTMAARVTVHSTRNNTSKRSWPNIFLIKSLKPRKPATDMFLQNKSCLRSTYTPLFSIHLHNSSIERPKLSTVKPNYSMYLKTLSISHRLHDTDEPTIVCHEKRSIASGSDSQTVRQSQ